MAWVVPWWTFSICFWKVSFLLNRFSQRLQRILFEVIFANQIVNEKQLCYGQYMEIWFGLVWLGLVLFGFEWYGTWVMSRCRYMQKWLSNGVALHRENAIFLFSKSLLVPSFVTDLTVQNWNRKWNIKLLSTGRLLLNSPAGTCTFSQRSSNFARLTSQISLVLRFRMLLICK